MTFDDWFEAYERDGGELMLYNALDLDAAFLAGAASQREQSERYREALERIALLNPWSDIARDALKGGESTNHKGEKE